ncbi:hypothetical protein CR513_59736, partial [Mucuna pruriens]
MDASTPWFADICNFIVASRFPPEASRLYKEKIKSDAKYYIWDDLYLWKCGSDQLIRRCILDSVISSVLHFYHAATRGNHHGLTRIARKDLGSWKLLNVNAWYSQCTPVAGNLNAWPSLVHHYRPSIGDHRGRRILWKL